MEQLSDPTQTGVGHTAGIGIVTGGRRKRCVTESGGNVLRGGSSVKSERGV